jgi:hypothetical protein
MYTSVYGRKQKQSGLVIFIIMFITITNDKNIYHNLL